MNWQSLDSSNFIFKKGYNFFLQGWEGLFIPSLNQAWIIKKDKNEMEKETLCEEFFHSYSTGLTPSHLYPLHNDLCRLVKYPQTKPDIKLFEMTIESLFPSYRKVVLGMTTPYSKGESRKRESYERLSDEIISLSEEISKYHVGENISKDELIIEAFHSLFFTLLHIVPKKVDTEAEIIKYLRENAGTFSWSNRYEFYFRLFKKYDEIMRKQPTETLPFELVPPLEPHRIFADIITFLDLSLEACRIEALKQITQFVPSLILVFSSGILVILPVIYLEDIQKYAIASIEAVHTSPESSDFAKSILSNLHLLSAQIQQERAKCFALEFTINLIEETRFFAYSADPNRVGKFLFFFTKFVHQWLLKKVEFTCPLCEDLYEQVVLRLKEHICSRIEKYGHHLATAGENYEQWLTTDCAAEAAKQAGLTGINLSSLLVKKLYSYL